MPLTKESVPPWREPSVSDHSDRSGGGRATMVIALLCALLAGGGAFWTYRNHLPAPTPTTLAVAKNPLRLNDIALMLRAGLSDNEIIDATSAKDWVTPMTPETVAALREAGAGSRLMSNLSTRPMFAEPGPAVAAKATRLAPVASRVQTSVAPLPTPSLDHTLRDKQVQSLSKQIDALDEQIRCIRTGSTDTRYNPYYSISGGNNQQARDNYIKQLDDQRNELRREKWQLEGR